jgi:hypothetical protein
VCSPHRFDKDAPQQAKPVVKPVVEQSFVISPPAELKYVISPTRMTWDDAVKWAESLGMRLATTDEMREMSLPAGYYWSGKEYLQSNAWYFRTLSGTKGDGDKCIALFAVAVAKRAEPVVVISPPAELNLVDGGSDGRP